MDFFLTAVTAIAGIIGKKILEKNGGMFGDVFNEKAEKFLQGLKKQSPEVSTALENAPETSLNYPQTVSTLENALKIHPELIHEAQAFLDVVDNETIPNLQTIITEIYEVLKAQPNQSVTYVNNVEKLVNLAQGNATIKIDNQTINL